MRAHSLSMFINSIQLPGAALDSVSTSAANFRSAVAVHICQSKRTIERDLVPPLSVRELVEG